MTNTPEVRASSEQTEEEKQKALVERVKEISSAVVAGTSTDEMYAELQEMPREVLIEAAWRGIANFHGPAGGANLMWGSPSALARNAAMERNKDFRLSLLDKDEYDKAVAIANDWLDEHFGD